jgi:hypothetical protein
MLVALAALVSAAGVADGKTGNGLPGTAKLLRLAVMATGMVRLKANRVKSLGTVNFIAFVAADVSEETAFIVEYCVLKLAKTLAWSQLAGSDRFKIYCISGPFFRGTKLPLHKLAKR